MNNLAKNIFLKTYINSFFTIITLIFSSVAFAQSDDLNNAKNYVIGDIAVTGNTTFSPQTVIAYSGLRKGESILIPGEKISNAVKKLWNSNLFI